MSGNLSGKTALVTGAAYGERAALGATFAKALAEEGASVVLADVKDPSDVADDIASAGGKALALTTDVSDEAQVQKMVATAVDHFGGLDILVNNAAQGSNIPPVPVTELSVEDWDALMAVNVKGVFLCVKAAVPQMKAQGYGKIINIGSTTMMTGLTNRLHYVSAKGAILAMSRSLAAELGGDGIRVNTLAYNLVTSGMMETVFEENPQRLEIVLNARALPEHVRPDDLAGSLIYLASPASDSMTGQVLVVNAGESYY